MNYGQEIGKRGRTACFERTGCVLKEERVPRRFDCSEQKTTEPIIPKSFEIRVQILKSDGHYLTS